jgi:alpha-tubulin suppressor-like RCC1 family protein
VKCWGYGEVGQLGTGSTTPPEICDNQFSDPYGCSKTPVDVVGLTSGVSAVAAGTQHACAIMEPDGTVKCWGKNQFGELGNGATGPETCDAALFDYDCSPTPVDVVGLTDVVQVEAGASHTCARTSTGAVKCWGLSGWGQLGDEGDDTCSGEECSLTPVVAFASGVQDIAAGGFFTCAINEQGGAECFGSNSRGQVGNGEAGPDSCHVGFTAPCSMTPDDVVGLGSGVTDITAGGGHACALAGGEVKCWGNNRDAQLANDNGAKNCSIPADECYSRTPVAIAGVGGSMVEAGDNYTCVGPGISCWGANAFGALHGTSGPDDCDSGFKCSVVPVSQDGLAGDIIALAPDRDHTCVLETGGKIECWGWGYYGQMGNGENENSNPNPTSPTGFEGITSTPTAAAHPIGDADCNDVVNEMDGGVALGNIAGVGSAPGCIDLANVKCDDGLNVVDVLLIFKHAAGLAVQLPVQCRAIGT